MLLKKIVYNNAMIKVAVTGNIASGKSCVEEYIKQSGYKVIDADKINHEILSYDENIIRKIKNLFTGYDILSNEGNLSREKIGKIVFSDKEKMKQLENILYKEISKRINRFFEENKSESIVFVSAAMLFESGFYKDYDKIIFVSASSDIRKKRLIERNNYTEEYAQKRISAQECEEEKIKKSDFVIENNTDLCELKNKTLEVLRNLTNLL